jgi:hypothetical protein
MTLENRRSVSARLVIIAAVFEALAACGDRKEQHDSVALDDAISLRAASAAIHACKASSRS